MAGLRDLATRASRIDAAVDSAQRGAVRQVPPGAPAPDINAERAKLLAELKRLLASNDPISAAPRKRRIARIEQLLAEMPQ